MKNRLMLHLDTVTILRGISCLIIITIHAPLPYSLINASVGISIATVGFIGIYSFFFLSGFILGKGYLAGRYALSFKGTLAFYWKRFRKIAPFYYLVLFYLFILTPSLVPEKIPDFIRLMTFMAPEKINLYSGGYLWFISTIMQLYFFAPVIFVILKYASQNKIFFRVSLFIFILLLGGLLRSSIIPFVSYELATKSLIANFYVFLLGAILSSWKKDVYVPRPLWAGALILIPAAFYLALNSTLAATLQTSRLTFQTAVVPSISYILIALLLTGLPDRFTAKVFSPLFIFQIIGIFSYEIYLLHQPIFNRLNLPCALDCIPLIFIKNIAVVTTIALLIATGVKLVTKLAKLHL